MPKKPRRPRDWSAEERLRVVNESAGMSEEELGVFLRAEGLHRATLLQWREAALGGLSDSAIRRGESRELRALRRELRRKEKALAEAAALLVLQKKSHALLGADEDDDEEPR